MPNPTYKYSQVFQRMVYTRRTRAVWGTGSFPPRPVRRMNCFGNDVFPSHATRTKANSVRTREEFGRCPEVRFAAVFNSAHASHSMYTDEFFSSADLLVVRGSQNTGIIQPILRYHGGKARRAFTTNDEGYLPFVFS